MMNKDCNKPAGMSWSVCTAARMAASGSNARKKRQKAEEDVNAKRNKEDMALFAFAKVRKLAMDQKVLSASYEAFINSGATA